MARKNRGNGHRQRPKRPTPRETRKMRVVESPSAVPEIRKVTPVRATYSNFGGSAKTTYRSSYCGGHRRDPVELLDGLTIYASAYSWKALELPPTDIGFYLADAWIDDTVLVTNGQHIPWLPVSKTLKVHYPWRDGGTPESRRTYRAAMLWLLEQLREGKTVEVGCYGAHGRTGTVLASLLVLQGMSPGMAVAKIRSEYCDEAIETESQFDLVASLADMDAAESPQEARAFGRERRKSRERDWRERNKRNGSTFGSSQPGSPSYSYQRYTTQYVTPAAVEKAVESGPGPTYLDDDETDMNWRCDTALADTDDRTWMERDYVAWWECEEGAVCVNPPCKYDNLCSVEDGECFEARLAESRRNTRRQSIATRYETDAGNPNGHWPYE